MPTVATEARDSSEQGSRLVSPVRTRVAGDRPPPNQKFAHRAEKAVGLARSSPVPPQLRD